MRYNMLCILVVRSEADIVTLINCTVAYHKLKNNGKKLQTKKNRKISEVPESGFISVK